MIDASTPQQVQGPWILHFKQLSYGIRVIWKKFMAFVQFKNPILKEKQQLGVPPLLNHY